MSEHYLLVNESFLDSLSAQEQLSAKYSVYGYLRDFYFSQQKPAEKERPVEQPEPANQPEPDDEDVFIFDDEDTITMPQQPAVESGQPQNFDIEDEYYELDGF